MVRRLDNLFKLGQNCVLDCVHLNWIYVYFLLFLIGDFTVYELKIREFLSIIYMKNGQFTSKVTILFSFFDFSTGQYFTTQKVLEFE